MSMNILTANSLLLTASGQVFLSGTTQQFKSGMQMQVTDMAAFMDNIASAVQMFAEAEVRRTLPANEDSDFNREQGIQATTAMACALVGGFLLTSVFATVAAPMTETEIDAFRTLNKTRSDPRESIDEETRN